MDNQTAPSPFNRAQMSRDAFLSLAGAVLARGGMLILQIGVARILNLADFDFFVTASIIGALVFSISDMGLTQAAVFVARGDQRTCTVAIWALRVRRILYLFFGTAFGFAALGLIDGFGSTDRIAAGLLLIASYGLQSYSAFLRAPLLAGSEVGKETQLMVAERFLSVAGGLLGLLLGDLIWAAIGQVVGACYGIAAAQKRLGSRQLFKVGWNRSVNRYGFMLSSGVAATLLYARMDYLVITETLGVHDAAIYAAAYSLVLIGSMLPISLARAALAHVSGLQTAHGRRNYLQIAALVGIAGALSISLLGPWLVRFVYDLDHRDLADLSVLLGLAFVLVSLNSTIMIFAGVTGREQHWFAVVWSAALLNLILSIVMVQRFGIVGGGIATLGTECWVLLTWWTLWTRMPGGRSKEPLNIHIAAL